MTEEKIVKPIKEFIDKTFGEKKVLKNMYYLKK